MTESDTTAERNNSHTRITKEILIRIQQSLITANPDEFDVKPNSNYKISLKITFDSRIKIV